MDALLLARIQFALTVGFHYIFPPLTIGLAWMIFYYNSRHLKTGEAVYKQLSLFWTKIFAVSFVVGVASGITMEFQFGTNWARYSRFVGDIFGAPLAAEGVFAFFLESSFLGILLYGRKKVSQRIYWLSSLMVALGATLSAFWIIVANSWQQTPAGFKVEGGKAVLTDFWAAVFNPSTLPRYFHVITAALCVGVFFILGTSAWQILKGRHVEFAKRSMRSAVIPSFLVIVLTIAVGHHHGVQVAETQPAKLAAYEGLWKTQDHAPLLAFGIPNEEMERDDYAFEIPGLVSLMVGNSLDTEVKGLKDFKKEDRPPVLATFLSFHVMLGLGLWFAFLALVGLFLLWKKKLEQTRLYLWAAALTVPLPFVANEVGWMAAEIGRQPFVVYPVESMGFEGLRTAAAHSAHVSAGEILASIIMFSLIYSLLFCIWIYLLRKQFQKGPESIELLEGEVA
ncbi:MAG: cytochrome ubiquinol oxidase subunit I [Pontiellaceae bacterium]|nr:cytochrome ubiquinol oxidase subunit I [Pontiellaceae bacterium]